jgi:type I site-specific restriction endonuclease
VRGKLVARGTKKRADYVLYLKSSLPLAVVEAKEPGHGVGDGMRQALDYAEMLGVSYAFASNGAGFLCTTRAVHPRRSKDLTGWRPEKGKLDKHGEEIENRVYNQKDFDRTLVLEKRTEVVAKKLTELLRATGQYSKTIVFCDDIDLAPGETLVSTIDPIVPAEPSDSVGSSQTGNGPWPGDNGTEKTSAS